ACAPGAFQHAVKRLCVSDTQAPVVDAWNILLLEDRFDLRPRAVHDDQLDAEAVQQVEVVDDAEEGVIGDDLAAESDHKSLAAKRVYVRRGRAYPLNERARRRGIRGWIDARSLRHRGIGKAGR